MTSPRRWMLHGGVALVLLTLWHVLMIQLSGAGLYVDEAQYWDWSRHLAWGYYSKPPVIAVLIHWGTALAGDGVLGIRWPTLLCWMIAGGLLGYLGRCMGGDRAGAWAAGLFWFTPAAAWLGLVATTDAPLMLCWAAWMVCTWQALQPARAVPVGWVWWAAAGVVLGWGLLSKYTMLAAVPSLMLWMFVTPHRSRRDWAGLGLALVLAGSVSSPHWVWSAAAQWPTWQHTAQITVQAQPRPGLTAWTSCAAFILGQGVMLGPAAGWVAWRLFRTSAALGQDAEGLSFARRFAAAMAWPVWSMGAWQAWHARAELNWAAPALLGACLWLALAAQTRAWPRRSLVGVLAVSGLLCSIVPLLGRWELSAAPQQRPVGDIWARMRGWDTALNDLRPMLAREPDVPILTDARDVLVHARYAWRDVPRTVTAWPAPPGRWAQHHYEWTSPWPDPADPQTPSQLLWLGTRLPEAAWRRFYPCATWLASSKQGRVEVSLWRLTRRPEGIFQCP